MIHVFDVDHTVLGGSSMRYFLLEAVKTGVVRLRQLRRLPLAWLKYKLGRPDFDFIARAVELLPGIAEDDLRRVARASFEKGMRRDIYPGAARLIREALAKGEKVVFASASLDVAIEPLKRFLGVEDSLACRLEFAGGKTTGRLLGQSPFGPGKRDAVKEWMERRGLDPGGASFYSDSYADIPLLEFCGRQVAVNPDRRLAKTARRRGWEIVHFRKDKR